jgi:hypothetical protein
MTHPFRIRQPRHPNRREELPPVGIPLCVRVIEDARSDVFAAYSTRAIRSGTGTPDCDRVRGSS